MSGNTTPEAQGTREAAKEQKAAQALNDKIIASIRKAESSLEAVAVLLVEAKESNIHTLLGHSTWQAYVESVVAASDAKLMGAVMRNQMLKLLLEAGVSVRAAARATGTSAATASRVANGSTTGERKGTPGAPKGVPQAKRTKATMAIDAIDAAIANLDKTDLNDMSALLAKLTGSAKVVEAAITARRDRQAALVAEEQAKAERKAQNTQGTQARTGQVAA
ncbi:hypothetical protein VT930_11890 [Mycobacterium sherrisii]|uniref:hypothetical protein n=1 Tax=Mycobacterium sherrisii TaxID=243061 RepID=UPI002DDD85A2|nr:hypothetical protein [Mycobacterium sherrisii]MEC4763805.1 hypothetical protein [Mycobacterium sherrisii]